MGRMISWFSSALFCLLLVTAGAFAQGVGSSGDIQGTVTDPSGAIVPKANVTVVDTQTGLRRTAVTDASGQFRIPGLAPAPYDVSVQASGFAPAVHKGVVVSIGQTTISDFQLRLSQVATEVEVSSEAAVVQVERAGQANSVPEKYITDLPIDRRDYLTFTLLMPGVSNSNTIADNADFRVKQTPQSGLSFYGSNGRGNSVTVDGGEANDDAGGVRLNVSQDAVQEFQINRSNYAPELGGASGASVNIVTKSGSNTAHGGLFGFFRNDAMDARNPFAFTPALAPDPTFSNFALNAVGAPIKNSLSRQQFGGTIGFPIKKDRTFLFVGYEGLRSDAQDAVPLLTHSSIFAATKAQDPILGALAAAPGNPVVPCINPPGQPTVKLPSNLCALALQSILTIDPTAVGNPFVSPAQLLSKQFIVHQFEKDGGLFPFPIRQHDVSGRFDHRFSDNNQAFLRYSYAHQKESDPDVQALIGFSRGTSVLNWDSTLQGSWFHQFSSNSINEARLQWNIYTFNVDTNDRGGPGLDVQGFGFFGRGIFLPSHTTSRRYEFTDNFTVIRGHHTMRMGFYELIRGNNTTSDTFFPGRFEFLDLPGIVLSNCLQIPSVPIALGGCGLPASVIPASLTTLQAWALGAPAFFEQGFGDPKYIENRPFTAGYWQDSWQVRRNFTLNYGLRYELDSQYGPLNTYKKDFAPRLSFAWDPLGDQKTVVRGGYGIFYSPIYAQIPNVVKTLGNVNGVRQIANTLVTILGTPPANSAEIYGAMFARGKILCGTPTAGANSCITQADLAPFIPVSNTGPLPPGTVLFFGQPNYRPPQSQQASFGIERQIGNSLSLSANYIYVHTTHLPWAVDKNLLPGAPIVSGTGANGLPTNGLPFQDWEAPQCFINPALCFADPTHTILQNNEYSSIANAVYHGGILELRKRFSDSFTLIANYTYSKAIDDSTDFNSDYAAFNEVNLAAERSLSDFDQRHKVVMAAVLDSPWKSSKVLSGFELSPIISYNSGHPFNLLAGADINGDGHFTNDRPPGSRRNSGIGPNYVDFDMRLSRSFHFGERAALQFTVEGFNIANRTNYAAVNNIVGANFGPPFNVQGTASLSPSQPLGFTSALPKRELQLGVRLSF
ncbi:MAG TPA: carboxypeptidase regulatory-like domain-containing protein [Terriglobales bacterium]|nr:carboxypeptidase regulatory-like domain-containing protein [Terriglobales bacterium]